MKNSKKFIVTAGVISVGMMAAVASATPGGPVQSFGVLNYDIANNPGNSAKNIAFTVGNAAAIGNDGYEFSNHYYASGATSSVVTIGLKAIAWQGANFNLDSQANGGDITYSTVAAGGSWLNRDSGGTYLAATGAATETRVGGNIVAYTGATRSRWAFVWNASLDGARPVAGLLNLRMTIVGPAAGVFSYDIGDLNGDFNGNSDPRWQNAWNAGFSFLSSAGNVNQYGTWNIKLEVFDKQVGDGYTNLVGEQDINVLAVPAPGALALLGVAGLAGGRRRRA